MIRFSKLSPELPGILKKLYDTHFSIKKMIIPEKLIDNKKFSSLIEMATYLDNVNDTNAFFCQVDGQKPHDFSPHSFGIWLIYNLMALP